MQEIGLLVRKSLVHRITLQNGNQFNEDLRYGDMNEMPWYRQPEDDVFPTTAAILAELFRRDPRGLVLDRATADKLVLTCRFVAILTASILKAKGIPCRVRSGFEPYCTPEGQMTCDHWICQYWDKKQDRWITIDPDCSLECLNFDSYDMPSDVFHFAGPSWKAARSGKQDPHYFCNACGYSGYGPLVWELFYDFHSLMNHEIIYMHSPKFLNNRFTQKSHNLSDSEMEQLDELAEYLSEPDQYFDQLHNMWETKREFRLLGGALL